MTERAPARCDRHDAGRIPYFDMSSLVPGGSLRPGDASGLQTISFFAPARGQFTYDLVFFAAVNQAPHASRQCRCGVARALLRLRCRRGTDPDGDALTFSLVAGPASPDDRCRHGGRSAPIRRVKTTALTPSSCTWMTDAAVRPSSNTCCRRSSRHPIGRRCLRRCRSSKRSSARCTGRCGRNRSGR